MRLNQSVIKRLSTLLESLHSQSCQIDESNTHNKSHRLVENNNLFSQYLFSSQSDKYSDYSSEIKKKLSEFAKLYSKSNESEVKTTLAKAALAHIEQQLSALLTAIQSNSIIHDAAKISYDANTKARKKRFSHATKQNNTHQNLAKAVLYNSHQLHSKLTEHHEFERRLLTMISDRESKILRSRSSALLNNEVLALHQRLGRCRKAIYAIEVEISKAKKSHKN